MTNKTNHKILCQSSDFHTAKLRVIRFFEQSMLLNYDDLEIDSNLSYPATSELFWQTVDTSILENRKVLTSYMNELRNSGCENLSDIENITAGYQSKIIHLIAHFVDGFIGIDSLFFCLPEDSHWVSDTLRTTIRRTPEQFWLLHVKADFDSIDSTTLVHHL